MGKRRLIWAVILLCILLAAIYFVLNSYSWSWTGFGSFTSPDPDYNREKTLWDWMNLLLVPLVLFVLAIFFSEMQRKNEQEIRFNNEQADILQSYLDKIQALILDNNLLNAKPDEPVITIARVLTLTTLNRLSSERKGTVLGFLVETGLIQSYGHKGVVSLSGADLNGVGSPIGLAFINFSGADLRFADLSNAKLDMPNFMSANLEGMEVGGARFLYADFRGANLEGVYLTGVNLFGAKFDTNTTLPNGQKWANTDMSQFGAIFKEPYTKKEYKQTLRELGYKTN